MYTRRTTTFVSWRTTPKRKEPGWPRSLNWLPHYRGLPYNRNLCIWRLGINLASVQETDHKQQLRNNSWWAEAAEAPGEEQRRSRTYTQTVNANGKRWQADAETATIEEAQAAAAGALQEVALAAAAEAKVTCCNGLFDHTLYVFRLRWLK